MCFIGIIVEERTLKMETGDEHMKILLVFAICLIAGIAANFYLFR